MVKKIVVMACAAIGLTLLPAWTAHADPTVYTVPSSVANDCSVDVTGQLQAFIDTVPDGSVIQFGTDGSFGCYEVEGSIVLNGRHDLTLEGNGWAALIAYTDGTGSWGVVRSRALVKLQASTGITVDGLTLLGPATGGPGTYNPNLEEQDGVYVQGSSGVTISNDVIWDVHGDGINMAGWKGKPSQDVSVTANDIEWVGRQGVTFSNVTNGTVQGSTIGNAARYAFDIEPPVVTNGVSGARIEGNTVLGPNGLGFLADAGATTCAGGTCTVRDTVVDSNTLQGAKMEAQVLALQDGVTFTNNVTDSGGKIVFAKVKNLTVTGNQGVVRVITRNDCNYTVSGNSGMWTDAGPNCGLFP